MAAKKRIRKKPTRVQREALRLAKSANVRMAAREPRKGK